MISFKRGDRGIWPAGRSTFMVLEDSVPYFVPDYRYGMYISMRVLNEKTGQVIFMEGFPSWSLEKFE